MKIAVHGAQGTGKAALATALAIALNERGKLGMQVALSPPLHSTGWDLMFVCGLDWPLVGSAMDGTDSTTRESEDAMLRATLSSAGLVFQVVYGSSEARLATALKAIEASKINGLVSLSSTNPVELNSINKPQWQWDCDKCGDFSCERRLFTDLLRANTIAR